MKTQIQNKRQRLELLLTRIRQRMTYIADVPNSNILKNRHLKKIKLRQLLARVQSRRMG